MKLDQVCFRTNHLSPSWTLDAYRQVGGYQVLEVGQKGCNHCYHQGCCTDQQKLCQDYEYDGQPNPGDFHAREVKKCEHEDKNNKLFERILKDDQHREK